MKETWRWFGSFDKISLDEIRQTGAQGIVSSLHEIPYGEVWPRQAISDHKRKIQASGMQWDVVESLPVHESIKKGAGQLAPLFANYRQSMTNLAQEGITTICYNFMPLLDWTRTTLDKPQQHGGTALRFDLIECAAFDLFILGRQTDEYESDVVEQAKKWWESASNHEHARLSSSIMAGLPGAFDRYSPAELNTALADWNGITSEDLRNSLSRFLDEVIPAADELGIKMCIHPDDPPRPLFGLPRIVSTEKDFFALVQSADSLANGITLCSGSLGAHPDNDVSAIANTFAERIHFAHLRNVVKDPDGSFEEAAHLKVIIICPL